MTDNPRKLERGAIVRLWKTRYWTDRSFWENDFDGLEFTMAGSINSLCELFRDGYGVHGGTHEQYGSGSIHVDFSVLKYMVWIGQAEIVGFNETLAKSEPNLFHDKTETP